LLIGFNIFPSFLAYFPYFEKIKVDLWDRHAVCLHVCVWPLPNFEFLNQSLWNVVCISWHLSPSQKLLREFIPLACVSVCVSATVARQRLGKNVTAATNTNETRRFLCGLCRIKEKWTIIYF
jgi:hypothetical protein